MADESPNELLSKLKKNLHVVLIAILVLFLALIFKLHKDEGAMPQPAKPTAAKLALRPILPSENSKTVAFTFKPSVALDQDPRFQSLPRSNMFQVKTPEERENLVKSAMVEHDKALALFKEGKFAEARKILAESLSHLPSHALSKELLKQIDAKLAAPPPAPAQ